MSLLSGVMQFCTGKSGFGTAKGYKLRVSKVYKGVNTSYVELAFLMALSICNCYLKVFKGNNFKTIQNKSYGSCALHVV